MYTYFQIKQTKNGDDMKIEYRIYELRARAGMTVTELAEKSGVSKSQINLIENNGTNPTVLTICLIAEALGVQPSELFFISEK